MFAFMPRRTGRSRPAKKPRTRRVKGLCQHCHVNRETRPRRLCFTCYASLDIRVLYPSTSKHAKRGIASGKDHYPDPAQSTDAVPGSEEKILVMIARIERGEALFHADDPEIRKAPPVTVQRGKITPYLHVGHMVDDYNVGDLR